MVEEGGLDRGTETLKNRKRQQFNLKGSHGSVLLLAAF